MRLGARSRLSLSTSVGGVGNGRGNKAARKAYLSGATVVSFQSSSTKRGMGNGCLSRSRSKTVPCVALDAAQPFDFESKQGAARTKGPEPAASEEAGPSSPAPATAGGR